MEALITVLYIAACVLLFSLAIAVHEFGHFIAALKLGLRVEAFSIGFGPVLWKKTHKGVEYRLSAIPLGGYVSIPDVDPEGTKKLEGAGAADATVREKIPAWKELIVAVAGPLMNLVLAVVLAVALSLVPGVRFGRVTLQSMHVGRMTSALFERGYA
jgi:regulator of sigma E protease